MLSIFCSPARYVQGRNATASLGQEMAKLGLCGPAFIIAGHSASTLLTDSWTKTFQASGITHHVHVFGGECTAHEIEQCKVSAIAALAKVIIGAGGGKVLDTARAVAAELALPVVNCPTLASSDAPCSALSVIYTETGAVEELRFYPRNPDLVLVDTTVIAQSPPRLLVAGMGDALATWFEARTARAAAKANQVGGKTTMTADALASLCYQTLLNDGVPALQAVQNKAVTPALERLVEANTLLSGLGFESGGLAVAHSVHNGLTTVADTHAYYHGEKVAFGLLVQLVLEGQAASELEEVMEFCHAVGLPTCLRDIGIQEIDKATCNQIAERTTAPGETAHNEPFTVTPEMVADAIMTANGIGERFKLTKTSQPVQPSGLQYL